MDPQATTTWRNRNNPEALEGLSTTTQVLVALNTSSWCIYGLLTRDIWLPLATIVILPLALITIYLKVNSKQKRLRLILTVFVCYLLLVLFTALTNSGNICL